MIEAIQQILDKAGIFQVLGDYKKTEWIVSEYSANSLVEIKSVYAHRVSEYGLEDYGTTYVLDSNFNRILKDNGKMIPSWYQDSVEYV